jgi:hypothetical protein
MGADQSRGGGRGLLPHARHCSRAKKELHSSLPCLSHVSHDPSVTLVRDFDVTDPTLACNCDVTSPTLTRDGDDIRSRRSIASRRGSVTPIDDARADDPREPRAWASQGCLVDDALLSVQGGGAPFGDLEPRHDLRHSPSELPAPDCDICDICDPDVNRVDSDLTTNGGKVSHFPRNSLKSTAPPVPETSPPVTASVSPLPASAPTGGFKVLPTTGDLSYFPPPPPAAPPPTPTAPPPTSAPPTPPPPTPPPPTPPRAPPPPTPPRALPPPTLAPATSDRSSASIMPPGARDERR